MSKAQKKAANADKQRRWRARERMRQEELRKAAEEAETKVHQLEAKLTATAAEAESHKAELAGLEQQFSELSREAKKQKKHHNRSSTELQNQVKRLTRELEIQEEYITRRKAECLALLQDVVEKRRELRKEKRDARAEKNEVQTEDLSSSSRSEVEDEFIVAEELDLDVCHGFSTSTVRFISLDVIHSSIVNIDCSDYGQMTRIQARTCAGTLSGSSQMCRACYEVSRNFEHPSAVQELSSLSLHREALQQRIQSLDDPARKTVALVLYFQLCEFGISVIDAKKLTARWLDRPERTIHSWLEQFKNSSGQLPESKQGKHSKRQFLLLDEDI